MRTSNVPGVDSQASVVRNLTRRLPADASAEQTTRRLLDQARTLEDLAVHTDDAELAGRASVWAVAARCAASDLAGGGS